MLVDGIRKRVAELAAFRERLGEVAIAVATEQRSKVKAGRKRAAPRRKAARTHQKTLRAAIRARARGETQAGRIAELAAVLGESEHSIRRKLQRIKGARRTGSGISIEAVANDDGVTLKASNQVGFLRRQRGEAEGIQSVFRERLIASLRRKS